MESIQDLVVFFKHAVDVVLHLDVHLNAWVGYFGSSIYWVLFFIIFCETGLVVTPFLPGDSLLFALGALCAVENAHLDLALLCPLLILAAVIGDTVNFHIGKWVGPKVFKRKDSLLLNQEHLNRTQRFYKKYGGKTIFLARFVPLFRTFAPFVAGIGNMNYFRFIVYNVVGGVVWIASFLVAGYYFGNIPAIKTNFHIVIFAIIIISLIPPTIEYYRARRQRS